MMFPQVQQCGLCAVKFNFRIFLAEHACACNSALKSLNQPRFRHGLYFTQGFANEVSDIAPTVFSQPNHDLIGAHGQFLNSLGNCCFNVIFCQ